MHDDRSPARGPRQDLRSLFKNPNVTLERRSMVAMAALALLAACGGGDSAPPAAAAPAAHALASLEVPGSRCPGGGASVTCATGGSRVESGLSLDRSGLLGVAEVTATTRVCHGSHGAAGSDGDSSLIAVVAEPAGVLHCAAGGSRVTSGPDSSGNGLLDSAEVGSTAYICNGVAGSNGTNGATGAAGANGAVDYTKLIVSGAEPAGANCAAGGIKIISGADTSRDGVLDDPAEVTTISHGCNGAGRLGGGEREYRAGPNEHR